MKTRVLVIDDEENIRRVMRIALGAGGWEVGEAGTGEEGLAKFESGEKWDVVLVDQRMPGMDGLETISRIREIDQSARLIMVSAYASIELAVDAMKLGATDFVRKPMTPEILRNAVSAALEKTIAVPELVGSLAGKKQAPSHEIDTVTMNGFHVYQPTDETVADETESFERRFVVKAPGGDKREVTVEISRDAVEYLKRMTNRSFAPSNSFWTIRAQRILTDYLWTNAQMPPDGHLTLQDLSLDDIDLASRWEDK